MARAVQFTPEVLSLDGSAKEESRLFSTTSVLNLEKLIFCWLSIVRSSDEHCAIG